MQGYAFMGKHEAPAQEYGYGFRGRMDERYDMVRSVVGKRYIYIRNYMPHKLYGQHVNYMFITTTTQVWKRLYDEGKLNEAQSHFWKTKPAEELYDLEEDPDEVNNLVGSKKHQDILDQMRKAHRDHVTKIRDVGFLPEGEIHSRSKGSTPYEMGHDDKKYPFKKIHAAADLASSMRKSDLPKITSLLEEKDSAVRYWGAVGILNRGAGAVAASRDELVAALEDESTYVRVVAALALGKFAGQGDVRRGVETLVELSNWSPQMDVFTSMAALNALDKLDGKAAFRVEAIKSLPRGGGASPHGRYNGYVKNLVGKTLSDLGAKKK